MKTSKRSMGFLKAGIGAAVFGFSGLMATPASADTSCMIGEVKLFAGNFAPRDWAFANGQLIQISQNSALFSILGTTYGGDGRQTFGLPDLRGRAPVGAGQGPGLSNRSLGQKFGAETAATLNVNMKDQKNASVPVVSGQNPIGIQSPSLGMHYIVCLTGWYPSRS